MIEHIDKVVSFLRKYNNKAMNPRNLIGRIKEATSVPILEIYACMRELRRCEWVSSAEWDDRGIPVAKLFVKLPPEPLKPYEIKWREALLSYRLSTKDIDTLIPVGKCLEGMDLNEMTKLINGLVRLRDDLPKLTGERLFNVSSRYLLKSSKMLRYLPNRVLTAFGIQISLLAGPPRYVKVAGAVNPKAVTLVENPHAFESAVLADHDHEYCWISAEGYGLSKQEEDFGRQLTNLVEDRDGVITLSRREMFVEFQSVLNQYSDRLYFWGDLDLAGLDIYGRLKRTLLSLQLSPLYNPMIVSLKSSEGHSYTGVQKDGQVLREHPFEEIKELALLCASVGVDQESVVITHDLLNDCNKH